MAEQPTIITTPRAVIAGFSAIQRPALNFNKDGDEYKITIAFEDGQDEGFFDKLDGILEEFFQETIKANPKIKKTLKKAPIGREEFDDEGEETGRVTITLKQPALIEGISRKSGKPYSIKKKVSLKDSKGNSILALVRMGAGSIVRCSFELNLYYSAKDVEVGCSFNRLRGVQLLKLVEYAGSGDMSAEALGFEAEEDGFDASEFVAENEQGEGSEGQESVSDF